jgi:hypothetical protein
VISIEKYKLKGAMWNSFNSPGNENLKPDADTGLVNNGVDGAKSRSGGHSGNSGASKPCRRPLRLLQVSPHNGESNFEHAINSASTIKRSPLKSLYESGSNNIASLGNYDQSPMTTMRSPNKNKLSTKNDFSPSGKSIQRISTMLVHRQRSDMAVISKTPDRGDSFDRNRAPSSSKSKVARVIESKAVRIRLNGNKKENSIEILGSPNSNSCSLLESSMNSPMGGKAIANRRHSQLPKPRSISNSNIKSTGKKANELSMSSFRSPTKKSSSSFREEGANDSKVGFSESLGLFFFSPADNSSKHPMQRPIVDHQGEWAAESGVVTATGTNISGTSLSNELNDNYYTPYTTGAGVSLNRPSMQRSHAKPTLSSASREKDSKRGSPDKAKSVRQSPQKSAKFKKLLKVEHPMYVSDSSPGSERARMTPNGPSPSRCSAPLDISSEISFIPGVKSHSDAPSSVLCLSPQRARVTLANINAPLSVNWRDAIQSDVEPPVCDGGDIDTITAELDALSFRGDLDLGSSYGMRKECCYETDVSSDESTPQTGLEHVTRVQMRSQNPNPSQKGSPFSFPRQTGGLAGTPSALIASKTKIELGQKQLIADTANNLTSSINGITRSMATADPSTRPSDDCMVDLTGVRASPRSSPVEVETETDIRRKLVAGDQHCESRVYLGSKFCTADEDSVENSSLCFSAENCVASSQIFKLPEDSFCKSDYYELIRTAREENTRGVTPTREPLPLCGQRYAAQPTSWLSLQSPIDKMQHRGLPKSAVKSRASPQIDLLYTPQPSQPYLRRSASRERELIFKANGEELEEGEIDEGVCSNQKFTPEVARSSDTLARCPGLDELLWGPNATSPSEMPMVPNSLNFSSANTPLLNRGPFGALRGRMLGTSSSPLNIPFSLGQAEIEDCSPSSARQRSQSASPSAMGSAVRLSPKAAQLTEDLAAADALVRMMQMSHLTPSRFDDSRDISNSGPTNEDGEADADDSSIFALDCVRNDRHQESECDSESERSQIQEISAVLKNLREGDVCCRMSSERGKKEEEEEEMFGVRPLDFALGLTASTRDGAAVDRSAQREHGEAPECSLALRDERLEISAACTEDLDSSAMYTTATTISLDFPHDPSYANSSMLSARRAKKDGRSKAGGPQSGPLPNLLVTRKKRRKDAAIEMKEIVLKATPGDSTTVALTFGNSRPGVIILRPKAILVRYEPSLQAPTPSALLSHSGDKAGLGVIPGTPQRVKEEEEREKSRRLIFSVTPESLPLLPGAENILHVTFSPSLESSGVYSGALKIKAGNKVSRLSCHSMLCYSLSAITSIFWLFADEITTPLLQSFVMLLRGEVVLTHSVQRSPSRSGDRYADRTEEREEAPRGVKVQVSQTLPSSQQVSVMTVCSPARETVQHTHHSTALSPYKSNYEGSISSLDNALTRAINTSRGVKGYTNEISVATGQQLIDDIEMQQDKVRHWLEMEKDRLLGPSQRSGEPDSNSFIFVSD